MWKLKIWENNISSSEVIITIKTVWAWFDLTMNKSSLLTTWLINIIDWNSTNWFGFDNYKNENWIITWYSNSLSAINWNTIWTIEKSINTNWEKNIYTYKFKYWSNINTIQAAWIYKSNINYNVWLTY